MKAKIIYGCESRGDAQSPYLVRWKLIENKLGAMYLHRFLRSDADEHHDHPWAFVSIILWRGYNEETCCEFCDGSGCQVEYSWPYEFANQEQVPCVECEGRGHNRKRVWPGFILFRKATHRHSVKLVNGKEAWTIVIRGKYVREWGFFTKNGWQRWKEYFQDKGC